MFPALKDKPLLFISHITKCHYYQFNYTEWIEALINKMSTDCNSSDSLSFNDG